jgi:hypothetical protein
MGDDLRWETMAYVADGRQGHTSIVTPARAQSGLT